MSDSANPIPVVDAHHHFWDLVSHRYPWLDPGVPSIVGDPSPIRRSYGFDDYKSDHGSYSVVGSVHLDGGFDPADPVGETRFVDRLAQTRNLSLAIVGHVPLHSPLAQRLIEDHMAASSRFRGVRHIVAWHAIPRLSYVERPDFLTDPPWLNGYGLLRRYGLSADLQIYPSQMPAAAVLAARFDDVPIAINQAGMPDGLVTGDLQPWRDGVRELASRPNVFMKISGFGMLKPDWDVETIRPLILHLIECFGPDRVMFGSNFPVDKLFGTFVSLYDSYFACTSDFDSATKRKLFAENAARFYRIADIV